MDYRKSYSILHLGELAAVLLVLCAISFGAPVLIVGGVVVAMAGILQAKKYYKCPHCGEGLSLVAVMPRFCPHCGGKLRVERK